MKKKDQRNFYSSPRNNKVLDILSLLTGKNISELVGEGIELLETVKYKKLIEESGIQIEKVISVSLRKNK